MLSIFPINQMITSGVLKALRAQRSAQRRHFGFFHGGQTNYAPKRRTIPYTFLRCDQTIMLQAHFFSHFQRPTGRQGTMSFLKLAHKSLAAPAANPVTQLYRSVNK